MIIRLRYRSFPRVTIPPVLVPVGSPQIRYRPVIPARVSDLPGGGGSILIGAALADPGSDFTILRGSFSVVLGLGSFMHQMNHRWQGRNYGLRFAAVQLEVGDARGRLRWPAKVGFTEAPIPYSCLLGVSGFFEFFDVRFCGERQELEIEPNGLFKLIGGVEMS